MTSQQWWKAARLFALAVAIIMFTVAAGAAIRRSGHELILNYSPSVPRGLYWIRLGATPVQRGDYVVFAPPDSAAALIYGRGWLPNSMPLLKPVGGLEGDTYCVRAGRFLVDGVDVGPVFLLDAQGLPLPQIGGGHRVGREEFLPLSSTIDRSFDGRYMGAIPVANVLGTGVPLLTF